MANRADREAWKEGGRRGAKPAPPPEYEGLNASKLTLNQAEFDKRKACGACYHCPMTGPAKVDYTVFHTQCPTHGRSSSSKDRRNPSTAVRGAGKLF